MFLSMSCPTPTPTGRVGNLANCNIKISAGAKLAVMYPPPKKGIQQQSYMFNFIVSTIYLQLLTHVNELENCQLAQEWNKMRCQIPYGCMGWGMPMKKDKRRRRYYA